MDPRERWQALQAHLNAARAAQALGDLPRARLEVDAALAIDPDFLAAQSLREDLLVASAYDQLISPPPAGPPAPSPNQMSAEGYARFEERARRRRAARRLAAAREALAAHRTAEARDALDEARQLDPDAADLADLRLAPDTVDIAELPLLINERSMAVRPARHGGARMAAALAFAVTCLAATWLQEPSTIAGYDVGPSFASALPGVDSLSAIEADRKASVEMPVGTAGPVIEDRVVHPRQVMSAPASNPPLPVPDRSAAPPRSDVAAPSASTGPATTARAEEVRPAMAGSVPTASVPPPPAASVTPSRPTDAPAPPPAAAPVVQNDEVLVRAALQRYQTAYDGLDARSAQAVWPAVDEAALARAFAGLASQRLAFDRCDVRMLQGDAAAAVCRGRATYVARYGSREPQVEPRVWRFTLRKTGGGWRIESALAER